MTEYGTRSITRQIAHTQDKVNAYLYRVEILERKLKSKEMSMDDRTRMEVELAEIKESILKSENDLKNFYGENRKTMMFVVMLMFFSFLFYGLYVMIYGPRT